MAIVVPVLRACAELGGPAGATSRAGGGDAARARRRRRRTVGAQRAGPVVGASCSPCCRLACSPCWPRSSRRSAPSIATPAGIACVVGGGLLNVSGWCWMRRVIGAGTMSLAPAPGRRLAGLATIAAVLVLAGGGSSAGHCRRAGRRRDRAVSRLSQPVDGVGSVVTASPLTCCGARGRRPGGRPVRAGDRRRRRRSRRPTLVARRRHAARQRPRSTLAMPSAIELVVVCIHAGLTPARTIEVATAYVDPVVAPRVRGGQPPAAPRSSARRRARRAGRRRSGPRARELADGDRRRRPRRPAAGAGARPSGVHGPGRSPPPGRGGRPAAPGPAVVPARRVHVARRSCCSPSRRPCSAPSRRCGVRPRESVRPRPPTRLRGAPMITYLVRLHAALLILTDPQPASPPFGTPAGSDPTAARRPPSTPWCCSPPHSSPCSSSRGRRRVAGRPRSGACSTASSTPSSTRCEP